MDQPLPKVSVVCAWYNRADYVRDTVDSLLAQDYGNFDITLVNDGSPDPRVREILDSYDDPRLRVIHQENTGFTFAIRRAIDESDGEYIAIQGAGDVSLPGRLSAQVGALKANDGLSIVGCWYTDKSEIDHSEVTVRPKESSMGQLSHFEFSHGELMYPRNAYVAVGGYRPTFTVGQGADLWMRLLRTSASCVVEENLYVRRLFADGVSADRKKIELRQSLTKLRLANERVYRKEHIDLIDLYGPYATLFLFNAPIRVRISIIVATIGQYLGLKNS
ncbi:MAG: glycosyltransferase family 2 protein [Loktanella sp.]|nr:glycosyltransferase family 2 protein [Loktanella sp.]